MQRRGWYPIGSNPTIETSNSWDKVTVLGAVTDDGDSSTAGPKRISPHSKGSGCSERSKRGLEKSW
ncbi:hypothetical protein [Haloarcula halobia]|uniref:hypothetical protein n=1 Tax=Haloarcula halobia TaxID=3033388 RepID=UPI0023EAD2A2|nr:hypothetical protein [Halomicroarcula sp. XH51]